MSTYKVIQDIEAEDKILGPLTLKQFIAGLVAAFFFYLSFISYAKGAVFLLVIFIPLGMLAVFFAFPFGKDQPTEVWAAAKFQFLFKPRRRIWDQSGVKELVTITVPKKIERIYTDGLSQHEVKSRLRALADTIDSRGWVVKGIGATAYSQGAMAQYAPYSDRLLSTAAMPQAVPDYRIPSSADVLDDQTSPVAQQFIQMINASQQAHRQQLMSQLNSATPVTVNEYHDSNQQWFSSSQAAPLMNPVIDQPAAFQPAAGFLPTESEVDIINRVRATNAVSQQSNSHLRTIQPLSGSPQDLQTSGQSPIPASKPMTATPDPAILSLANNNDLNISTIAREAQKAKGSGDLNNEVVVSLR